MAQVEAPGPATLTATPAARQFADHAFAGTSTPAPFSAAALPQVMPSHCGCPAEPAAAFASGEPTR
eukprot:7686264-Lingulodinium_polyedra.AAC.1